MLKRLPLTGLFQACIIFVGISITIPTLKEVPSRCFTSVGSDLTHRHWTKLKRPNMDKHSGLFWHRNKKLSEG
jgi:hypothetical protein